MPQKTREKHPCTAWLLVHPGQGVLPPQGECTLSSPPALLLQVWAIQLTFRLASAMMNFGHIQ